MQGTALHPQRQALLRHRLSECGRRLRGAQLLLQGLHRAERHHPHPATRGTEGKCLVFEGFMDYLSFLTLRVKNCPAMPNLDRQDYIIAESGNVLLICKREDEQRIKRQRPPHLQARRRTAHQAVRGRRADEVREGI